jgi:hypothetical protein
MITAKTKIKLWPPIHELHYDSGKVGWQVACQVRVQFVPLGRRGIILFR